jgi:hypothetical protein
MNNKTKRLFLFIVIAVVLTISAILQYNSSNKINTVEPEIGRVKTVYNNIEIVTENLTNIPVKFSELKYLELYDTVSCTSYLEYVNSAIEQLNNEIDSNEYTVEAVNEMTFEIARLRDLAVSYEQDINHYIKCETEYPYATKTWQFFKQLGYSDAAVCGILGNMMVETSGGTLGIVPTVYSPSGKYYGLCQWSKQYYPEAHGKSFEWQLNFLKETIDYEFATYGSNYSSGFTIEDFKSLDDSTEAALAFAKVYERCGFGSYTLRMQAAVKAYEYFNGETQ